MKETTGTYSTEIGQLLVIMITGMIGTYLAEVIEQDPLVLKVEDFGHFSRLMYCDFIIREGESVQVQSEDDAIVTALFKEHADRGRPLVTGLRRFHAVDNKLLEILPVE